MAYTDQDKAEALADAIKTEGRLNYHVDKDDLSEEEVENAVEELDDITRILRRLEKRKTQVSTASPTRC